MNNIDFYAELYKSDSEDECDDVATTLGDCMITHAPIQELPR